MSDEEESHRASRKSATDKDCEDLVGGRGEVYYDQYIYHPLLIFEGTTGHVLGAQLRPGNEGGATRLLPLVGPIVRRLQRRFPTTAIALRADADFATPEVLLFAETEHCPYAIGLRRNPVLEAAIAIAVAGAECRFELGGEPVRDFTSFEYQATSWPHPRRVVAKIEITSLGRNVRFLVTNRPDEPAEVFAWYNRRGAAENCIKDLKNGLHADRLSCSVYRANAFRLQLHVLAYAVLALFRPAPAGGDGAGHGDLRYDPTAAAQSGGAGAAQRAAAVVPPGDRLARATLVRTGASARARREALGLTRGALRDPSAPPSASSPGAVARPVLRFRDPAASSPRPIFVPSAHDDPIRPRIRHLLRHAAPIRWRLVDAHE